MHQVWAPKPVYQLLNPTEYIYAKRCTDSMFKLTLVYVTFFYILTIYMFKNTVTRYISN